MRKVVIIAVILGLFSLTFCAPPRSGSKKKRHTGTRVIKTSKSNQEQVVKTNSNQMLNLADTTIIELKPETAKFLSPIEREFIRYSEEYYKSNYKEACPKMEYLAQTFAEGDSLKYEATFISTECLIYQDDISGAEKGLKSLINNPKATSTIRQKAIVRLGQVYCYLGKETEALKYFDKLKKEYPNSKYVQVANCEAVKK